MAAVLLATGAAGHRAAMPNARVMIHQPVRSGGSRSNARQMAIDAASIEKSRLRIAELLALRTGRGLSDIEALIEYDHVCDAAGALELGLVDRIVDTGGLVDVPPPASPPAQQPAASPPSVAPSAADGATKQVDES